ncbi:MAG: sulfur carrier protein ThiS, partial [Coprobacter sp.]|nr:sulfur carrier protein ThiS [Coprobacter sp.]
MKKIILNREVIPVSDDLTLAALLAERKMDGSGVAAAVNNRVVPRDQWGETL